VREREREKNSLLATTTKDNKPGGRSLWVRGNANNVLPSHGELTKSSHHTSSLLDGMQGPLANILEPGCVQEETDLCAYREPKMAEN
jgi:hypothetical protein